LTLAYVWALPLAVASFGLQVRPRWRNRYFGIDTWRHLAVADFYRRRRRDPHATFDRYLIDEPSDYPPVLRWLLSLLSRTWVERSQWFICPLIDLAHNLLLFGVAYTLTQDVGAALAAQAAYLLAPLIVMENSSLTTRPLASLLFSGLMLLNLRFAVTGEWVWLPASMAAGTLLFLTHRMSIQALTALTVILTAWFRTPYYAAALLGGWGLAVAVSRGFYWRVFTGHLAMLAWWRQNIHHRYAHQVRGLPRQREESADPVFRIYQLVRRAPFVAVFAANPFVLCALALTFDRAFHLGVTRAPAWDAELELVLVWAVGLLAVGLAVRQFRFLEFAGEGERYGEYAAFPSALAAAALLVVVSPDWRWAVWTGLSALGLFGGLLPALYLQQKVVARDTDRSLTPSLRQVLGTLEAAPAPARLMTVPLALADFALYFTARTRVLSTDSSFGHLRHYSDFWPVLRVPITTIFARYAIDTLLVNEQYVRLDELHLPEALVTQREGQFCLVRVDGLKESPG